MTAIPAAQYLCVSTYRQQYSLDNQPAAISQYAEAHHFTIILVYDGRRWSRFQDAGEAAHYEFMCKSCGAPVDYPTQTHLAQASKDACPLLARFPHREREQ